MDFLLLLKILLEWSFKSKEYAMISFIYSEFNIGIPNHLLYFIKVKNNFSSMSNFLSNHYNLQSDSLDLDNLLQKLKRSKYQQLPEWNNRYGYKLKTF